MVHGLSCSGMWDLPGPGLEPVSPALAGGFLTTAPPGNSMAFIFKLHALFQSLYKDLLTLALKISFRTVFSQAWYCSLGSLETDAETEMEVQVAYLESTRERKGVKRDWAERKSKYKAGLAKP